jgi:outer membrane protein OmpA-like peptidoglycan-associated protein
MKRNCSIVVLGLLFVLAGCGTAHNAVKMAAPAPNKMKPQLADFSALGQASLTDSGLRLVVPSDSLFKTGHTALSSNGLKAVDALAMVLGKYPSDSLTVAVYTDNGGGDAVNLKVAKRRADRIKKELLKQGVSVDHVTAMGKGDVDPVGDNATDAGRAKNRRVDFDLMEM